MPASLAVVSFHTSPLARPGLGDAGGMNVYVRALSGALARAGVTCDIYTRADTPTGPPVVVAEPGVRVFQIEAGPRAPIERDRLLGFVPLFARRVVETAAECRRAYDMVHSHYWLSGEVARFASAEWGIPFVHTFHTLARVRNQRLAHGEAPEPASRLAGEDRVVASAARVLASTAHEAHDLVALYGTPAQCTEVVPPGVDHRIFRPASISPVHARRRLGLGRKTTLLCAGRIQPLKGFDTAVLALAELAAHGREDVQLVILGGPSGPGGAAEVDRIRSLAHALHVNRRVRMLDPVPHERLAEWYQAADVVLVPSRSESFGLVALEAQACGVPVVVSDIDGLKDCVEDGTGGFRVPPGDHIALARAIESVLGDAVLADRLARGAAAWSRRFGWSATAVRLRQIYADMADAALRAGCGDAVPA